MAELQKPTNLNPLPLGMAGAAQPLPSATPPVSTSAPTVPDSAQGADPVEQWMNENPKFDDATATTPNAPQAATETPAAAPTGEVKPVVADATPNAETPTTETPAAAPTTPQATEQPAAQPTAATPQPKPTFALDEKIGLADGVEWTRGQIVEALKERAAHTPLVKEAEGYKKLFGMSLEDAEKNWSPILQRLSTEPNTLAFLDSYLGNAEKAAYLEQCATYFDTQNIAAAPAPATAIVPTQPQPATATDPVLARELAELKAWRAKREEQESVERVNREMAQVTQKYPFLATDQSLLNDLLLTAKALYAQDPTKGILDALALKAPMYDALAIARGAQASTPAPALETPAPQPTVLASSGASPNGARPSTNGRPKQFGSTDDAVDDWFSNPPPEFRG